MHVFIYCLKNNTLAINVCTMFFVCSSNKFKAVYKCFTLCSYIIKLIYACDIVSSGTFVAISTNRPNNHCDVNMCIYLHVPLV